MMNDKYPLIENHGIIGNLNTVALVCLNGSIDFMCFPYFDSPSIFAALLDPDRGGYFQISPSLDDINYKQMYLPDTNILLTRFLSSGGVSEITDFMPVDLKKDQNILIRRVTAVKGDISFRLKFIPRFYYAQSDHQTEKKSDKIIFSDQKDFAISLQSNVEMELKNGDILTEFKLQQGDTADFILSLAGKDNSEITSVKEYTDRILYETVDFWKQWVMQGSYNGLWRDEIYRSALTIKLLTSKKYGSIIASPSFGLPEYIGGERNWDYRYCWIRDSSFSVYALIKAGYKREAKDFIDWVEKRCEDIGKAGRLSIMYTVSGKQVPEEISLKNLKGYKNSQPVRIGNNARKQLQLDIYGELIDAVYLYCKHVEPISYDFWEDLIKQVNWLKDHWRDKDEGIWEVRGGKRDFLHSRFMSWVAFDRILRIGEITSYPYPPEYKAVRDEIFFSIYNDFWNNDLKTFVQFKDAESVGAATLLMPLVRFINPKEKRWLSTLNMIEKDLVSDSLVFRYRLEDANYDPIEVGEGTFTMCSFWYVECLARAGKLHKARLYFEKTLGYGNHLGLFAEELSFKGEHLGNFPQAFTHIGLISAAHSLSKRLIDGRELKEELY